MEERVEIYVGGREGRNICGWTRRADVLERYESTYDDKIETDIGQGVMAKIKGIQFKNIIS